MFRRGGAVALVVVAVLAAAACGGTDWNAAHQHKAPSTAQLRAQAAAEARAEAPYVDAMVASDQANPPADRGNPLEIRCVAGAIVHGFGVQAFRLHGLTPNALRNPNSTLEKLPTPAPAQIEAVGAAMQRCPLTGFGQSFARGVGATDAATVACFTQGLQRPDARRFLVISFLGRQKLDLSTARSLVGLMARCTDLATLFVNAIGKTLDAGTKQCVITQLHGADAALRTYWALKIADADPDQVSQASETVGVAINQCRPGAQTGFTVPSN
jgi:hypothetical protein